jgi:ketosteroid isomerase-like protein
MNIISKTLLVIFFSCIFFNAKANDSVAVQLSVEKFVAAFNTLQWQPFKNSFTEDATIFFPDWEDAPRKVGSKEIEKTWLEIFPEFKDSANTFKLDIKPRDMLIQLYGQTAVVTFHLGNGEKYLARRTLVMVKRKLEWKIAHLHASVLFPIDNK